MKKQHQCNASNLNALIRIVQCSKFTFLRPITGENFTSNETSHITMYNARKTKLPMLT